MIIIGAGGHAKEIFDLLNTQQIDNLNFFDNVSQARAELLFGRLILTSFDQAASQILNNPDFSLGIGNVFARLALYRKFLTLNGRPTSVIADNAVISPSAKLGQGLNIMRFAFVSACTRIGDGCLINAGASVHHDVIIGSFVEISPGAKVLGNCSVGDLTTIGANATLLPKIIVGSNVVVAAGAVVTQNVPDNCLVAGVPAVVKKRLEPLQNAC